MSSKKITIICPTYNEEKYIKQCIDTILSQDYPQDLIQILIIDGLSKDKTAHIVREYSKQHKHITLIENPDKFVPQALNIGIQNAIGDVIIRIDAHCEYPTNYVSVLVDKLYELNADNVGGQWITLPSNDSVTSLAIATASSHIFGVGNSLHKTGSENIIETDTVPFGCYKKEVFTRIGLFDTDLIRNQDDEFNARLIKSGGKIYLIPQLKIKYYARDSFNKMNKMYYQYGLFKPLVNKKLKGAATIRQFFPMLFTLGILIGGILSLLIDLLFIPYVSILILYFGLAIYFAIKEFTKKKRIALLFVLPFTFFNIHLSYGLGYITGIIKVLLNLNFSANSSR